MAVAKITRERSLTLPVVLPLSWIDRLTRLANERGINRSALVREALQQTLFAKAMSSSTNGKES